MAKTVILRASDKGTIERKAKNGLTIEEICLHFNFVDDKKNPLVDAFKTALKDICQKGKRRVKGKTVSEYERFISAFERNAIQRTAEKVAMISTSDKLVPENSLINVGAAENDGAAAYNSLRAIAFMKNETCEKESVSESETMKIDEIDAEDSTIVENAEINSDDTGSCINAETISETDTDTFLNLEEDNDTVTSKDFPKKCNSKNDKLKSLKEERELVVGIIEELKKQEEELTHDATEIEEEFKAAEKILAKLKEEYAHICELVPKYKEIKGTLATVSKALTENDEYIVKIDTKIAELTPIQLVFSGSFPDGECIDAANVEIDDKQVNEFVMTIISNSDMYKLVSGSSVEVLKKIAADIAIITKVHGEKERIDIFFENGDEEIQFIKQYYSEDSNLRVIITD